MGVTSFLFLVSLSHRPQSCNFEFIRNLVKLLHPGHGHVRAQRSEPDVNQLAGVQVAVIVPAQEIRSYLPLLISHNFCFCSLNIYVT